MPAARSLRQHFDAYDPRLWSDATVLLGGGGARGLAHLGAMHAIGQFGIGVGRLVGVSMGALMASLCAVHRNVASAESAVREFLQSDACQTLQQHVVQAASDPHRHSLTASAAAHLSDPGDFSDDAIDRAEKAQARAAWGHRFRRFMWIQRFLSRAAKDQSLLPQSVLTDIIDALLPNIAIEDLSTPLHLITVDMRTGEKVVLSSGSLRRAVLCSMSIPGIFPAVPDSGRLLADVGVYDAVPCGLTRKLMESLRVSHDLIVVDVGKTQSANRECRTALNSIMRFQELAERQIRESELLDADVVIRPAFDSTAWFDFSNPDALITAGHDAGLMSLGTMYQS